MTQQTSFNIKDMPEFQDFCEIRDLAPSTRRLYEIALTKYVTFVGKNLDELIKEAEDEEDEGIRMNRRKVKKYLTTFKMDLKKRDYTDSYIKQTMILVRSYYNENDIILPREQRKRRIDRKRMSIDDLPTMGEIQQFMLYAMPIYRSMATIMLSSGMSRAEIASLTFEHLYKAIPLDRYPKTLENLIDELENHQDTILFWKIMRIKTRNPYFTFTSPEATLNLITYLKELYRLHPEYNPEPTDQLFRTRGNPITVKGISLMFNKINKKAGLRTVNGKSLVRPHSLRKYFATTLEKNKMPHLSTRWLMGHTLDATTESYFMADPETLRYDYTEVLDQIQTNEVQTVYVNQFATVTQRLDEMEDKIEKEIEEKLAKYKIKDKIDPEFTERLKRRYLS